MDQNWQLESFPQRIICMTEESVETLFALGKGHLIIGISAHVKRPPEACSLPKISVFTHAKIDKIKSMQPDLILGFSDIQKDIARDLIAEGLNVFITNQRSLKDILHYIIMLGSLVGAREQATQYAQNILDQVHQIQQRVQNTFLNNNRRKPKVYFEEWDEPMITAIRWVSELIELCGGVDINAEYAKESLGKNRIIRSEEIIEKNPDIILACWCGKKVDLASIKQRPGWQDIHAVKNSAVYELEPEIFLQPGPAPFISGMNQLVQLFEEWSQQVNL